MPSSFGLALLMHALLFGGMTLAVQWRTQPAAPVVAELWSSLPPQLIAVPEVAPPPPPPPPPRVEPEPEREAEIALKQEKKAPPKVESKKEEKKPEPKKEERKPEPKKEPPKEVKKVEAKKEEPRPRTDLERILAQAQAGAGSAPAPGGATTSGATASGVRGSDGGYSALVIACIKSHLAFAVPAGTSASVYADFRVELMPTAEVASVRLVRPSGLAGFDTAAERAIRSCNPFPRRRDGTFEQTVDVTLRPVEPR
jgi:colicin import membrane protein